MSTPREQISLEGQHFLLNLVSIPGLVLAQVVLGSPQPDGCFTVLVPGVIEVRHFECDFRILWETGYQIEEVLLVSSSSVCALEHGCAEESETFLPTATGGL